jgi:hypothetical protein
MDGVEEAAEREKLDTLTGVKSSDVKQYNLL